MNKKKILLLGTIGLMCYFYKDIYFLLVGGCYMLFAPEPDINNDQIIPEYYWEEKLASDTTITSKDSIIINTDTLNLQ